jgi:hypothetical protein
LHFFAQSGTLERSMVTLQILLKKEHRTPSALQSARVALQKVGLHPVSSGAASLTVDATPETLASLFGSTPAATEARHAAEKGVPASEFSVPPELAEFVESISIAPKHLYFQRPPAGRKLS